MTEYAPVTIKHNMVCEVCQNLCETVYDYVTISAHTRMEDHTVMCDQCSDALYKGLLEILDEMEESK